VQIHHAGQGRRESHAVRDRTVAQQSDKLVTFSDVVQKAANRYTNVYNAYNEASTSGNGMQRLNLKSPRFSNIVGPSGDAKRLSKRLANYRSVCSMTFAR